MRTRVQGTSKLEFFTNSSEKIKGEKLPSLLYETILP
jgi:hypothetical protein